jgi:ribosomal 30S subunit maturation factor RimM
VNFVCIGKILGTHGLKGYLKIKPDLALSEIIDQLVFLSILKDDTVLNFEVEKYFFNKSMLVTKFKRVDNIEEAKKLVGAKVICHENIYKMLNIGGDNYNELLGY